MKILYKIINLPLYLVFGLITIIFCISPIRKSMGKYDRDEINHTEMLSEINRIVGKFPLMFLWMTIPEWLRAFVTILILAYILH